MSALTDLKISDLDAASSLTGTETVPILQGGGNRQATLDDVVALLHSLVNGGGTITAEDDGSITLTPKRNAAIQLHRGDGTANLLECWIDAYSLVSPRLLINSTAFLETQAAITVSGWWANGRAEYPTQLGYSFGGWTDTDHCAVFRQGLHFNQPGQPTADTSAAIALKDAGTNTAVSGVFNHCCTFRGTYLWGTVTGDANPTTMNDASFGMVSGRLTASHLNIDEAGKLILGETDQGGIVSATRHTTGVVGTFVSAALADNGSIFSVSHTNAIALSSAIAYSAGVNAGVRGILFSGLNNGGGTTEILAIASGTSYASFLRTSIDGTTNWTAGVRRSDGSFRLCGDSDLVGSPVFIVGLAGLNVDLQKPPIFPASTDSAAPNGSIYWATDHGGALYRKTPGGTPLPFA